IGIVQTRRRLSADYFTDNANPADDFVRDDNETHYSLAYTLNAGLAYQVSKNLSVDLGYQYFSAPDAEYTTAQDLDSYPIDKGISN
ncbi:MAG: porin family protein, partial [Mesorhizobium sp.]